jgi:O-6-methylguanine DNA methyltransferase
MTPKTFTEKVIAVVQKIPRGSALTYQQVAERAGNPKAYRVVGTLMRKNYREDVPCHRVVRSDGTVGEYNRGGSCAKEEKLRAEGYIRS